MKIAIVCSRGGHLTQILTFLEAFKEHDVFLKPMIMLELDN